MQATILIIEDEPKIADLIALYLRKEGIETIHAASGEKGLEILSKEECDLIILDINLPGIDGFEVLQQIRRKKDIPVIIVSARQEDEDMIMGFGGGADDYVSKPFSPKVLASRVRAHLRRRINQDQSDRNLLQFGPFTLDRDNLWLKKDGQRLDLPPKEMAILQVLAEVPGRSLKQDELYEKVWGNSFGDITTVSVHIQRLRKKIEQNPSQPKYIMTAYGSGYYLSEDEDPIGS
jgi:DNA-binding response OmpR family regulator